MTYRVVSALAVLSLCLAVYAQKTDTKPTDTKPTDMAAGKPDYSPESFVLEQVRTTYRFENDGTGRREIYARIKVQSEAGVQQWGQVVIGYNSANERIEIPYVRVHKADGKVITAADDAVQDLSAPVEREAPVYTDFRQKHVTVPGLRPGEVLEYDVVAIIHTALAPNQFWMEHDFEKNAISLDEELDVNVPQNRAIKLKNKPGMDPRITEKNGRRVYHWTSSHLVRDDDDDKEDEKPHKRKKSEPEPPAIQLTTFANWQEVGKWYADLERDRRVPSPEIKSKVEGLTEGLKTDSDKIQALYDYVSTNFRYVSLSLGAGRYQPHAAADVFHNQYGDCKDKHTLLEAMLEASGYRASSVLINSSRKLDPDVPSPSQFDHVITLLPRDKDEIWMDTTAEVAPYRLLSFNLRKKQALVVPPDGAGRLEETPADTPGPNLQLEEMDGKISELGKLSLHVHYTLRGDTELLMRTLFRRVPKPQWHKFVQTMNSMSGLDGEVTDLKVGDPAATRQPFEIDYQLTKTNYFEWSKKKSDLILPLSNFALADADQDADTGPDADPIKFGPPGETVYRIKMELPAKYSARSPLPLAIKRDYADYQATYKLNSNVFTGERKLLLRERELPASRTGDYLAFRRAVLSDLVQRLSMESTIVGNPTPPANLKADELNESGFAAFQNGNLPLAIDLLKRAVQADPKHKLAWNNLGNAYLSQRDTKNAITAYNKQVEVNPYDEFAYDNIGRAYWLDRNYEAAAKSFRKQIEVNPLDRFAHANLGRMYAEWHKYNEAVPELEQAASLNPDDALLQVTLGDAYLNLRQDEKALATFDHAVELSATPVVWNNIAYQLSLMNSHLDKAQQYAESAVAATAAGLRNLRLEQLTNRDLALVPSLIAYWDTLGWVYYGRGDLDKAQKYVSAAWLLGQHGEVGDHLGQIYEKRGQKQQAIETYAQALNGLRPPPETRQHLAALIGGEDKVSSLVEQNREKLQEFRTLKVDKIGKAGGAAEFFVLFAPTSNGLQPENVRFVSGDETLQSYAGLLRKLEFRMSMPDDTPTKILRRGTLSCSPTAKECMFVMLLTDDVRSVD
jgi:tetratricopeptide (TPR) repeat protein